MYNVPEFRLQESFRNLVKVLGVLLDVFGDASASCGRRKSTPFETATKSCGTSTESPFHAKAPAFVALTNMTNFGDWCRPTANT